ncbi:MAG: hypothetical protein FJ041_07720 [Candidatus Cloacimonetes bacterium]|nr:hypothetical protein [Candidatus Cloacimonadota bacterium]
MKHTLIDGTVIELLKVVDVTEIKDYGLDENTIDQSTLSFTIRYKNGKSKKISMNYHYSDWFAVYNDLKNLRKELIEHWDKSKLAND